MTFDAEQRALAAQCWQFIGVADDLAADDAWIRSTLFGRDVFVQRFEGELRGFDNACAHRGFPLRRARAGTGPVRCGFHGWAYNKDGVPTTIPRNAELFGLSREQRAALALPAIRVAAIGRFVFGALGAARDLVSYLGPYADVYRAIDAALGPRLAFESHAIAADWKLHAEVSLDDYHLASVHETTFGAGEPLGTDNVVYRRDGLHSCYLKRRDAGWSFDGFWQGVAAGAMDRTGYKIFNAFPGMVIAATRDMCFASSTTALAADRCRVDTHMYSWADALPTTDAARDIVAYFSTVFGEDREVCARWQQGAPRVTVLGKLEERIAWFREAYSAITGL